jgi:hypothetical protein
MPTRPYEVHVNDIGTKYRVRVEDELGPFDPSDADVKQIIFKLPQGVITKDADVEPDGSPATAWFLTYTVTAGAGLGSPPGEFHEEAGRFSMQAYLEYTDGTKYRSSVQTVDEDGEELRIYKNLDDGVSG